MTRGLFDIRDRPIVLNFEPSQFELTTMAVVRSIWLDAKTHVPDRPVPEFLEALREAAVQ